jgi:hypothetical protein
MSKKVLELLITDVEKYFLWSAESNSSIFNFPTHRNIKGKTYEDRQDSWNNIWSTFNFSKKKSSLIKLKEPLIELNTKLQKVVKEYMKAKNNLLSVSKEISSFIQEKALRVFHFKKTLSMLSWIKKVLI